MKTRINVLDYGPVLIHRTIHEVTGRPPRNPNAACYEECEEPRVMAGFMNRLSDLDRWMKLYGQPASVWHYQGWDEPYLTSKVKQALWETTLVRKAGIRNTATVYDARGITEMGAYGLLTSINGTSMNNPERFRELTAIGRMLRVGFWLLGAAPTRERRGRWRRTAIMRDCCFSNPVSLCMSHGPITGKWTNSGRPMPLSMPWHTSAPPRIKKRHGPLCSWKDFAKEFSTTNSRRLCVG